LNTSDAGFVPSSYFYSIVSQPSHGYVFVIDSRNSLFQYYPSATEAVNGDSFTVQLTDGINTSLVATVTLSFSDETSPNITLSPSNNASNVSASTTFVVSSDDPIKTSTLTYNNSAGACFGTVQISKDNFSNCIGIKSAVPSNFNRTITMKALSEIDDDEEYKFKVTTGVENLFSKSVATSVVNTFNTSVGGLLITEVGESYYPNTLRFFEVYNPTAFTVDMSDYTFKSGYSDSGYAYSTAHEFSLPNVMLASGQYIVIRAQDAKEVFASNDRVIYVKDGTKFPYWTATGYVELLKSGITDDFVTFGDSYLPTTSSAWGGTYAPALPSAANQYGHSIGRDSSNTDTNSQSDWSSYDFATVGGVNDVSCTADIDADGIPDCSEEPGSTFAGLPLYDWGARKGQKDIFIEIDYMDATNGFAQSADEGITPRKEALQKVVDAFAAQGIAVHFDVGNLYDSAAGINSANFDLGGGEEVPFVDAMTFKTATSLYDYKLSYMDYARKQIFHYLIFANTQKGSQGSSGLAELNGNDLIVSLGEWGLNSTTTANTNILINYQASTLMHELGHNLGLYHGGTNDSNNYEPNYFSTMNYLYQLNGLSTIGSNEGDRIYYRYELNDPNYTCYTGLSNPPNSTTFVMDFSHGDGVDLDISSLDEALGLGQSSTDKVDYNCDGDKTDKPAALLDALVKVTGTSTDHDDWSNINLDFQRYVSGDNTGAQLSSARDVTLDAVLMVDKVGDDRSPVAQEYSPSPAFFERLREQMTSQ
jgi:hypothetical protein